MAVQTDAEYVLFLEDDLEFNRHIRHNLQRWEPLKNRQATLAGLYNPNLPLLACGSLPGHAGAGVPPSIIGAIDLAVVRHQHAWHPSAASSHGRKIVIAPAGRQSYDPPKPR
jgi:hypothetical protein